MVAAISALSLFVLALSAFGFMLWLHRLTPSIRRAIERLPLSISLKRAERLLKLPKKTRRFLSEADSNDPN